MKLPVTDIPRPTVASVLADYIEPDVLLWISSREKEIGTDAYKAFIATLPEEGQLVTLLHAAAARRSEPDAFAICEDLKNVLDWPVDGKLAELFVDGLKVVRKSLLRNREIEWVMKTGHRLHGKVGDDLSFYDRYERKRRTGKLLSVDKPVATGVVEIGKKRVIVYGEDAA